MTTETDDEWTETRRAFQRIAAKAGIEKVAPAIPADRATVYRLIRGDTIRPSKAIRAGIERIVADHERKAAHGDGNQSR